MFESLRELEQISPELSGVFLLNSGIVLTGVGLCIWLGGLRFKRFALALMVVLLGAASALTAGNVSFNIAAIAIGAAIVFVIIAPKLGFMVISTATVAVLVAIAVPIEDAGWFAAGTDNRQSEPALQERMDTTSSLEAIRSLVAIEGQALVRTLKQTSMQTIAISAAAGLVTAAVCFFLCKVVASIICSAFGTGLIFAGMVLLLLFKGSGPITAIYDKLWFYRSAAVCMIAFGMVMQLLLTPIKKIKHDTKKKANGDKK